MGVRQGRSCLTQLRTGIHLMLPRQGREGCPAPPLLQTCRDLGQGRDLAAVPSPHKGRQSRDVFLEGPENSCGSSQTAGQDEEALVMAIKRSQVLGWGARNPPAGQAGSEAAFHISTVRTFLFICSSVSAKKEGGAAPFLPHHACPQPPATAEGLKSVTPPPPAPSYQPGMFGLTDRF